MAVIPVVHWVGRAALTSDIANAGAPGFWTAPTLSTPGPGARARTNCEGRFSFAAPRTSAACRWAVSANVGACEAAERPDVRRRSGKRERRIAVTSVDIRNICEIRWIKLVTGTACPHPRIPVPDTVTTQKMEASELRYNRLGQTDLEVSAVSLGTSPIGDMFGPVEEADSIAVVRHALDAGVNFFDSSPYYGGGLAERRLGTALQGHRDSVIISTKAGRYSGDEFDFSPKRIRASLHTSLELLQTDHVDLLLLHDVDHAPLTTIFGESYQELVRLRDEGKCRYIGMTAYPMKTLVRAVEETDLDAVLSFAHFTLLNQRLARELAPVCERRGVGLINAAAVALGLLTRRGATIGLPVGQPILDAAERARNICEKHGADVAFLANQFAIQRSGAATTVVGTTKTSHLDSAVAAVSAPIDEELLKAVLQATADVHGVSWTSGLPENNGPV
jgi:aryl-alcohol dehydrogenase-like predicted oxidoreductase